MRELPALSFYIQINGKYMWEKVKCKSGLRICKPQIRRTEDIFFSVAEEQCVHKCAIMQGRDGFNLISQQHGRRNDASNSRKSTIEAFQLSFIGNFEVKLHS